MANITYSQAQREWWAKRPKDRLKYMAVVFYHPDFGYIRLVGNQQSDKSLGGNTFQAVSMVLPSVTNQSSDNQSPGSIQFGRIGTDVRRKLMQITPLGAIKYPITAQLLQFEQGIFEPIYDRSLFVASNGIQIGSDNVNIQLAIDNPSKLTDKKSFYDPSEWVGLQNL